MDATQGLPNDSACPCGSKNSFSACCGVFHNGVPAPTALLLMKSRYSAFACKNSAYLIKTWHPDHRPSKVDFDNNSKWLGLKIKQTIKGSSEDTEGWVHFVARYKIDGKAHRIEENSYFTRVGGNWVYSRGE